MKLKDVINRAISIIGLEQEVDIEVDSIKLRKLIDAANTIYSELTLEYVHLNAKDKLDFVNGRLYYTRFPCNVREVLSVKKNGEKIPFTMYPLFVEAEIEGEAEVSYLYHTGDLALEDEMELPPQFNEHTLAVGVASEYCYKVGLGDEAAFYKARYDNSVVNLSKRLRSFRLPQRRFLDV